MAHVGGSVGQASTDAAETQLQSSESVTVARNVPAPIATLALGTTRAVRRARESIQRIEERRTLARE